MKKNSDNTFLCFLAKIYFRIESYDNFNYSVPPWTTLFMIIGLIGCFFTLPLVLYKYLSDWQITWLNANDVIICLLCFWGAVVAISIALSILLVIKSGKYYKRMESYAGNDFLKQLEETRTIVLDIYDYKLIINALNEFRNKKIAEDIDTEIIDELIKKLLDAPIDKRKVKGNFAFER